DLPQLSAFCISKDVVPDCFRLPDYDGIDMLERFIRPVRNVRAAGHDLYADLPVFVRKCVRVARKAREERDRDEIGRFVDRDAADLFVEDFDLVVAREGGEMYPGDRRHEVYEMPAPVARRIAYDDADLHTTTPHKNNFVMQSVLL